MPQDARLCSLTTYLQSSRHRRQQLKSPVTPRPGKLARSTGPHHLFDEMELACAMCQSVASRITRPLASRGHAVRSR
ncbi:hypothetical protein LZ31DRAFT_274180 [Colletotrichum somersetense]|nr:hypothetical protein LZ31DRAFT_274180 [Colletotrichum somersetense]